MINCARGEVFTMKKSLSSACKSGQFWPALPCDVYPRANPAPKPRCSAWPGVLVHPTLWAPAP